MIKIECEGTDGAGKSTGMTYFVQKAREKGLSVVETREVGNPHIPICIKLRELVLDPKSGLSGQAMEFIFSAMRIENYMWLGNLSDSTDLVVSDRGYFSHLAYTDRNVSYEFTNKLYRDFVGQITSMPDIVIYFSVDTKTALSRRIKRGSGFDVIEAKGIEYQDLVRDSFSTRIEEARMQDRSPTFFTVDANQSLDDVKDQLDSILSTIIKYSNLQK